MKEISKALTLYYIEGVICVFYYTDKTVVILDESVEEHIFPNRSTAAKWFKKRYNSTLCF